MIKRSNKSISFLMEFIIVIFFFALSSAVCVHVYAQAETLNASANHTKKATILAQNYIATFNGETKTTISEKEEYQISSKQTKTPYEYEVQVTYQKEVLIRLPFVYKGVNDEK